ncbi:ATP-binding protein [Brevundimonas subvibrioides]|uniref:Sensory/regulatory protein RpfC n=1 Tax=Brevundimonas subvibrioides (strain ATCC 15264 / DSM 4735 / LMG 14903 / NBRC 16000 / CB 81) TaxID=633149 RepID=D9QH42_BRESC|nr:ATP-binding protein [Brevundimonas subvibrioides]ADL01008.1 integral membrane sensor hybrid histidine kinase [Brevundimonas subvibrioides ATCC 15264]
MPWIVNCLVGMHDWRLTLLAATVCVTGLATSITLIGMARRSSQRDRFSYGGLAGVLGGLTVWATHFLAMLGYRSGETLHYVASETLMSLAIVVVGMALGIALTLSNDSRLTRVLVAVLAVCSVAAMHFMGMAAIRIDGAVATWDTATVVTAVTLSILAAMCTAIWKRRDGWQRISTNTFLAVTSVCILHFGGMAGLTIVPDPTIRVPVSAITQTSLLIWVVGGATLVVAAAALVTMMSLWGRSSSLNQLREAIDTMPDGLGFYDADDRLVIWNARYAEVNTELAAALEVGAKFRDMLQIGLEQGLYAEAVGREQEWIEERLAARRRLSNTLEQQISGDRWLRVQDRRTAQGGIVTVVNDITDLKRDAQALAEARDTAETANRAKSEFLANMSHEIRTPLNGVIGLTQALARTELDHDQREILNLIQSSGVTLQTLLSDILDLARVESGRLEIADEPFDLARAINEAAHLYGAPAAEKGLQFFVDIDPAAEGWVRGDVVRLKQVLTNLVSNAVKFTAKGFVSLNAAVGRDRDGAAILRFTVEDTGVGFDAEAKARLFTRFEQADGTITRRFGGTGLGLAICRQLADMMGGHLDCESEAGGGSTFILTLPLIAAEAPVVQPIELASSADPHERRVRVLVADDHPTNRKVVELILGQAPVDLVSVEDGAQALAAARLQTFDLILMDMQMPVMDGLTAVREIRLHEATTGTQRTPVVMLTANALPDHIAAGQAAGADRHLAKPFDAAELIALVSELGGESCALAA